MQDGQTYVDGGIRTLAPVQAAIDAGASSVYVVAAGSTKMDPKPLSDIISGTALPLLGIALRVGEQILPDEVGRRDLFPSNGWPVPVVVISAGTGAGRHPRRPDHRARPDPHSHGARVYARL